MMHMINKAKEGLEDIFRCNDAMREKEHVHTARKYFEILSDPSSLFSSYELLETSSDDSYDSGTREKQPNQ